MKEKYVSLTELAQISQKGKSTIHYHKRKKRIKPVERTIDGKKRKVYPLNESLRILAKYNDNSYNPDAPSYKNIIPGLELYDNDDIDAGDIDAEKLRKIRNQNELMEFEIKKKNRELLDAEKERRDKAKAASEIVRHAMTMGRRIAPEIASLGGNLQAIDRAITTEARRMLTAIDSWIEKEIPGFME